jgi:hypothetical protein
MMAALCYNLKKLLNFKKMRPKLNYLILEIQLINSMKKEISLIFKFINPYNILQY